MTNFDYDLFVIGAGSGGVRAARIAGEHGAKVAITEEFRYGGTCVIRGCVPKKLYVTASRFADDLRDAAGFGWEVGETRFSWQKLVAAKEKEITRIESAYGDILTGASVTTMRQRARLSGPQEVTLADGTRISAKTILIATGGTPARPDFPGAELGIDTNAVFDLPALPERMIIQGGGYIAVEFACLLQRLGVKVTLVYRGAGLLRGFDADVAQTLEQAMRVTDVEVLLNCDIVQIARAEQGFAVGLSNGETRVVGQALLATGRRPKTSGLGLEAVGVVVDKVGAVVVNGRSQSNIESIYAVGDVTNRINLTPVAIREGHAFADSVFGGKAWEADHRLVPTAVFTTPEIGTIGLSEAAARAEFPKIVIYQTSFRPIRSTLAGSPARVFMKLVVDGVTDRVLGVHMVGEDAAEMVQLLAISVRMGATKADFDATMPVHPTAAEEFVTLRTPRA